ncbi:MAG TPA: hypothetical protein VF930_08490 [Stellaceae bacterium]
MRITCTWIAALALLGVTACAPATTTTKSWPEFRVPGADFAVSLPGKPEIGRDTTAKDGSVSRSYNFDEGAIVYSVAYTASTPKSKKLAPLDGWLDNIRDELVAKMSGKLRDERRLAVGDSRGMELVLDVPKIGDKDAYTIRGRFYVKHAGTGKDLKDMLYQTIIVGDPGHDADASVAKFLDSFHFVQG